MKGLVILGNGFEISEMTIPCDYLFRANIKTIRASAMSSLLVTSQEGIKVEADIMLKDVNLSDYDFLFIPGGKASFTTLKNRKDIDDVINFFAKEHKYIFSICAAPSLIGKLGLLKDKEYTCFPGFEKEIIGGIHSKNGVVVSDNFITAKSVYYGEEFALNIINVLMGKEKAHSVYKAVRGEA